jgi:hypothetical protein
MNKGKFNRYLILCVDRFDSDRKFGIFTILSISFRRTNYVFWKQGNNLSDKLNNTVTPEAIESGYLGYPTNENANKLFDYLEEYYRPNENTKSSMLYPVLKKRMRIKIFYIF